MGRGGAPARRGRAARGAKSQLGKDDVKSSDASRSTLGAKSTREKKVAKSSPTGVTHGGKAPVSTTPANIPVRLVPVRARRKPSRYTTEVTLEERDRHENEGNAVSEGMKLLDLFRSTLRKVSEESSESAKVDAAMRGKELMQKALGGHKVSERDWASSDVLASMSEALDLGTEPSLEYTLGVLGVTELPQSLQERYRALGAKKYNEVYKSSQTRKRREERERNKENLEKAKTERARKEKEQEEKEQPKNKSDGSGIKPEDSMKGDEQKRKMGSKEFTKNNEDVVQGIKDVRIDEAPAKNLEEIEEKEDHVMIDIKESTKMRAKCDNRETMDIESQDKDRKTTDETSKGHTLHNGAQDDCSKNSDKDVETKDTKAVEKVSSPVKTSESLSAKHSEPHIHEAQSEKPATPLQTVAPVPKSETQIRRSSRLKASEHTSEKVQTKGTADANKSDMPESTQSETATENHDVSKDTTLPTESIVANPSAENTALDSKRKELEYAKNTDQAQTGIVAKDDLAKSDESPRPFTRLPKRKGRSRFGAKVPRAKSTLEQNISVQSSVDPQSLSAPRTSKNVIGNQGHEKSSAANKELVPVTKSMKRGSEADATHKRSDMVPTSEGKTSATEERNQGTAKASVELSIAKKGRTEKVLETHTAQSYTGISDRERTKKESALPKGQLPVSGGDSNDAESPEFVKDQRQGTETDEQRKETEAISKNTSKAERSGIEPSSTYQKKDQSESKEDGKERGPEGDIFRRDREKDTEKDGSESRGEKPTHRQAIDANQEKAVEKESKKVVGTRHSSLQKSESKEKVSKQVPKTQKKRPLTTKELERETMAEVFGDSDSDEEMELDQAKAAEDVEVDQNDGDDEGIKKEKETKEDKQEKSSKEIGDGGGAGDAAAHAVKSKGKGRGRRRVQKEGPQVVIAKSERRVSSRRHSARDEIAIPQSKHTRLRRESTNLTDGRLMLDTNDEHILQCAVVWEKVQHEKISIPFRQPVQKKDAPDYFDIVKNPMDLATVRKNMERGVIKSPIDFYGQMMQIVKNAFTYNPKNSDLWDLATELKVLIQDATRPIVTNWCDTHGESYDFSEDEKEADEAEEDDEDIEEPEPAEMQKRKKRPGRPPKHRRETEVEPVTTSKRGRGRGRGRARGRRGGGINRAGVHRKRALEVEPDSTKPKKRRVGRPRKDGT